MKKYTTFGRYLRIVLIALGITSFVMLLGVTGDCELMNITATEYAVRAVPCLAVFCGSLYIYNRVFN